MWIFLNNAMFSIVEDADDTNYLVVRARVRGDIQKVWPDAHVVDQWGTDYEYRAFIKRAEVAEAIKNCVANIDYSNFKDSMPHKTKTDKERKMSYMSVWATMMNLQEKLLGTAGRGNWWENYRYHRMTK